MKLAVILVLVALVAAVFISGCIQEGPTGELTEQDMEEQAFQTVEQEMNDIIGNMTLEDLENELLG